MKAVPVGSITLRVTLRASDGPALMTVETMVAAVPAATGLGDELMPSAMSACTITVVSVCAKLLELFGSKVPLVTEASECRVPVVAGSTCVTMVIIADAPGPSTSNPHVAGSSELPGVPTLHLVAPGAVTDCTATPVGRLSLRTTVWAVEGPLFRTVTEKVRPLPAITGLGVAVVLVICRSDVAVIGSDAVAWLLALIGSGVGELAVATSFIVCPSFAVYLTTMVARPGPLIDAGRSVPRLQESVALVPVAGVPEHVPWLVVALAIVKVPLEDAVSVRFTARAADGPLLSIYIVQLPLWPARTLASQLLVVWRSASSLMATGADAVLLARLGSSWSEVTEAESAIVIGPPLLLSRKGSIRAWMSTLVDWPEVIVPSWQVSVCATREQATLLVWKLAPAGKVSVRTTFVAVSGPKLVTLRSHVSSVPATPGSGVTESASARSAGLHVGKRKAPIRVFHALPVGGGPTNPRVPMYWLVYQNVQPSAGSTRMAE